MSSTPLVRRHGLRGSGYRYLSSDSLPLGRKPHAALRSGVFFWPVRVDPRTDKVWVLDPHRLRREIFHGHGEANHFGAENAELEAMREGWEVLLLGGERASRRSGVGAG